VSSDPADLSPSATPEDAPQNLADRGAAAALSVPGVHDLHGGVLGEVATYLPGRRVAGVRLLDGVTQVHLVLEWDAPMSATIDEVRSRVAAIVPGVVHLAVEDVVGPAGPPTAAATEA
jgi:hypothetical protein